MLKLGSARSVGTARLRAFQRTYESLNAEPAPRDWESNPELSYVRFRIHRCEALWCKHEIPQLGPKAHTRLFNNAIQLGALRRMARKRHLEPFLREPDGSAHNLPPLPGFGAPQDADGYATLSLSAVTYHFTKWGMRHGAEVYQLAHEGVHILGALALLPKDSELAVEGETAFFGITPSVPVYLAEPFPRDVHVG